MTTSTTTLELDSDPKKVADLQSRLSELCKADGLDDAITGHITTVVVEAINNIIEHGYRNELGRSIRVHWRSDNDSIHIEIRDLGQAIHAGIQDAVMPSPFDEHGRGRYIILKWSDSARHDRHGDENVLNLMWRR